MKACRLRYNFNAVIRCFFIFWAIILYVVRPKINPFIAFCLVCWKVVEFLLTFFFFSYILLFVACQCFNLIFRGVAQLGRALRSGRRGRKFKSCHLDHKKEIPNERYFFFIYQYEQDLNLRQASPNSTSKSEVRIWEKQSGGLFRRRLVQFCVTSTIKKRYQMKGISFFIY